MYRRTAMGLVSFVFLLSAMLLPSAHQDVVQAETDATPDDEIIYIDNGGFIRVIDPNVPGGSQAITWISPDGGWYDLATGDFNADGDMEIVAIGNNRFTIFDPVVKPNSGVEPEPLRDSDNFVPWKRLFDQPLPGVPNVIGAGNLDQFASGDELVVGYSSAEGNGIVYRMTVYKRNDATGQSWTQHATAGFGAAWKAVEVGNVNNAGSADVVRLRDEATAAAQAVEVDNNWATIFERNRDFFTYTSAAIGQFYPGGTGEVVLTRTFQGTVETASILMYQFVNNQWTTAGGEFNQFPHPYFAFFADINGNGDDELFWIRDVTAGAASPRMVMVNAGGDPLPVFEVGLDADNGYRVGAGGDIDADGKEEVVVMRNNRILQFNDPENGSNATTQPRDVNTNARSLVLANLDGDGYLAANRFTVDRSGLSVSLRAGTFSTQEESIALTVTGTNVTIPFTLSKEGNAPWFSVNTTSNTTPATIRISGFSAVNLLPGVYEDRIVIQANDGNAVINDPVYIPIKLTVLEQPFTVSRDRLVFAFPIQDPTTQQESVAVTSQFGALTYSTALMPQPPFDAAVAALGEVPDFGYLSEDGDIVLVNALGEEYNIEVPEDAQVTASAIVWPSVPWATVQSTGNIMPDTIIVTATAAQMASPRENAILLVVADERTGVYPNNIKIVEVTALRDQFFSFMPIIRR